jgi:hypothetical protein
VNTTTLATAKYQPNVWDRARASRYTTNENDATPPQRRELGLPTPTNFDWSNESHRSKGVTLGKRQTTLIHELCHTYPVSEPCNSIEWTWSGFTLSPAEHFLNLETIWIIALGTSDVWGEFVECQI